MPSGNFNPESTRATAIARNMGIVTDVAKSFRRMQVPEATDVQGTKTIWHRARQRCEMLTWESSSGGISRQELTLFSVVLEFTPTYGVRTGTLPSSPDELSDGGRPIAATITIDKEPSPRTLEYASHLLRQAPERDYYMQHLLKQVNDLISSRGIDDSRTIVSRIEVFARARRMSADPTVTGFGVIRGPKRPAMRLVAVAAALAALAIIGVTWLWMKLS